jgi:hypothetical protein
MVSLLPHLDNLVEVSDAGHHVHQPHQSASSYHSASDSLITATWIDLDDRDPTANGNQKFGIGVASEARGVGQVCVVGEVEDLAVLIEFLICALLLSLIREGAESAVRLNIPATFFGSEGVGGVLGVTEDEGHAIHERPHFIMLAQFHLVVEFPLEQLVVLVGSSAGGMDDCLTAAWTLLE